ncbi:MAG: UPF0104 family protein [Hyphomicrobiales bacterium]|nr:UPF0104 family protein [Hyphomicrobiales bacterium]
MSILHKDAEKPQDCDTPDPQEREAGAHISPEQAAHAQRRFWWRLLATGFSAFILVLSGIIVSRILLATDYHALRVAIRTTSLEQFAAAFAFMAFSYLALTGYDAIAIRQLQLRVRYLTTALASFTSYAISFTLGFSLVTGGTIRYWVYSQVGLRAGAVASLTLIAGITFWLGMLAMIGIAFVMRPGPLSFVNQLSSSLNLLIGVAILFSVLAYVAWVSLGRRRLSIKGMILELPGFKLTLGQLALGVVDLVFASAVLYVLLPVGHGLDFMTFVAIYVMGCLLGIASNAPGGIGAFEVTILKMVPSPSTEALLAALLLFRLIYYLVPFVLAFALLGAHEGHRRWRGLRAEMAGRLDAE